MSNGSGTLERPVKNGGTREYVTENSLGYDVVQAPELDGDLNTIVDYVNQLSFAGGIPPGGVNTVSLADGAVTTPKLADLAVTDAKITSVDWSKVMNAPALTFLPLAGGTMTGPLLLAADPVGPLEAVTKQYLDTNAPVTVIGATPPAVPKIGQFWWRSTDGNLYIYYNDGVTSQWVPAMSSVGRLTAGQYYLLAGALAGQPTSLMSVGLYVASLSFSLALNLAGSVAAAKTAATSQSDFDIRVNGVSRGTMRWAAGATAATFLWSAAVAVNQTDRVEIVAPATPDTALADLAWTLRGTF